MSNYNDIAERTEQEYLSESTLDQHKQVITELVAALERAKDDMESWQSYASSYFQEKHDAQADLDAIDAAIARVKALEVA